MTELGKLLDRVGPGLFQQAYVVDDITGAQAAMQATLGCSAFATLPATDLDYNLLTRRATLTGVSLSADGHAADPVFTARHVSVEVPWADQ